MYATGFGQTTTRFLTRKSTRNPGRSKAPLGSGDVLGAFGMTGYGATGFNGTDWGNAGMLAVESESFTDSAQGTSMHFYTTPVGQGIPIVMNDTRRARTGGCG